MTESSDPPLPTGALPSSALAQPAVTENGGRVELRFSAEHSSETTITYRGRWFFDDQCLEGLLHISAPNEEKKPVGLQIEGVELPEWLNTFTQTLARTSARSALLSGQPFASCPWPRRITRWRKAPSTSV